MLVDIPWGLERLSLDVPEDKIAIAHRQAVAAPVGDVAGAVRAALEAPVGYPPLRRALTPDDHVAIVVDEGLPHLTEMLVEVFEHLRQANVPPTAVTLVCAPPDTGQPWLEDLPDAYQDVRVEVHQPGDRKKLAYLAATRKGRRVYLNRTVVDADQTVVVTRRRFDTLLGVSGGETAIFPALTDEATYEQLSSQRSAHALADAAWPLRQEAAEVAWLLGAPFLVQVIEGSGNEVAHVIGGPVEASGAGVDLLQTTWRVEVDRRVDLVVASVTGAPERTTFDDLARAYFAAARVVRPGGRIVVLSAGLPALGPSAAMLRQYEEPSQALQAILNERPADAATGFAWATAAEQAKLYLLSRLPGDTVEELFATPLDKAEQAAKLVAAASQVLFLPDADKSQAVVRA